jgi:hypothetical protein
VETGCPGVRGGAPAAPHARENGGGEEEGRRVHREEHANRQEREEPRRDRPAANGQGLGGRANEAVGLLDVAPVDEGGEEGAVRGVEVAGRGGQQERSDDQSPQRELAGQAGDRDRNQDSCAHEVGADEDAATVPPVGGEPTVEPKYESGHAVRQPHGEDAQRSARLEGEPHERDVLECVPELARRDRDIHAPEVGAREQREGAPRRRDRVDTRLLGCVGDRVGHRL